MFFKTEGDPPPPTEAPPAETTDDATDAATGLQG